MQLRQFFKLTNIKWLRCHSTVVKTAPSEPEHGKPFSQVPGPYAFPILGNFYSLPKYILQSTHTNEIVLENFKKYGPIYREQIMDFRIVYMSDVDAIEKMHRAEGKYPRRIIIDSWRDWRQLNKLPMGLLTQDGPEWKRMRSVFDKRLMKPQFVASYATRFHSIVSDFLHDLDLARLDHGNRVPNMDRRLFRWSLETIGTVLYEVRFGGVPMHFRSSLPSSQVDGQKYIQAVQNIFESTARLIYLPLHLNRIFFPKWVDMHHKAWNTIYTSTQQLIDWKLGELSGGEKMGGAEDGSGAVPFLASLLASSDQLATPDIYANISDIMLGAVDTTSNTMQWMLYELSRNQDLQQRVYNEINNALGQTATMATADLLDTTRHLTYEQLQNMPLLKAVVKETLRLYPVANVTSRILDDDIVLCGYHIPANTTLLGSLYQLGRDASQYEDPLVFRPERWLRTTSQSAQNKFNNFAWLPFGFGPRSCIGRRVAELEMFILLSRILERYRLEPVSSEELKPVLRGLLVPNKPVDVFYQSRN